jgi:hypothetical protein
MLKPLIKGLKLAPFVECPECHVLTEYGKEKCLSCPAALSSDQDRTIHIVMLNMGARYTPFVECPNCVRLVRVGVRRCPDCYEEIPEPYALASAITVVTNTIACDVAASLRSFDAFAVVAVILSVLFYLASAYVFDSPVFNIVILIWPIQPLILIILWFYRFGKLAPSDKEYLQARQRMKGSLILWLTILAVQSLALAVLLLR